MLRENSVWKGFGKGTSTRAAKAFKNLSALQRQGEGYLHEFCEVNFQALSSEK
jgi:hypothetical protein